MKIKNRIFSLIIATVIPLSMAQTFSSAKEIESVEKFIENKISLEVKNMMDNGEKEIPVYVWLKDINHDEVFLNIESKSKFNIDYYEDINKYQENVVPKITKKIENEVGIEKAHIISIKDLNTGLNTYAFDSYYDSKLINANDMNNVISKIDKTYLTSLSNESTGSSLISKAILNDVNEYLQVKRQFIKEAYLDNNNKFINKYANKKIIYKASYAPVVILEATKTDILKMQKDNSVEQISYYEEIIDQPEMDTVISNSNIGVSTLHNSGYTGSGVKIGIVESASGRYDPSEYMLSGVSNLQYVNNAGVTGNISSHATNVTTIIKGKRVIVNGKNYSGIVPDADVYQTSANHQSQLATAVDYFIDNGINIVNRSAGGDTGASYSDYDRLFDKIIHESNIIFIKSAGNTSSGTYVTSPGKAYNVITVGNVQTKSGNYTEYSAPYNMAPGSLYLSSSTTSKPEISAPGSSLTVATGPSTTKGIGGGTSYSAPIIAGISAQLIQARPELALNPSAVKSFLVLGADNNLIINTNNPITCDNNSSPSGLIRDKSGAGFVNAYKSLTNCISQKPINVTARRDGNTVTISGHRFFNLEPGDKLRAVMVFQQPVNETDIYDLKNNNLDLVLLDTNNLTNEVAYSKSLYNNVEIIEYNITQPGRYLLMADCASLDASLGSYVVKGSIVCLVE